MNDDDTLILPVLVAPTHGPADRQTSARSSKTLSPSLLRQREDSIILPSIDNANNWRGKLKTLRQLKGDNGEGDTEYKRYTASNTPFGMVNTKSLSKHSLPPLKKKKAGYFQKLKDPSNLPLTAPKPLTYKGFLDPDITSEDRFNEYMSEIKMCNDSYITKYLRDVSRASRERAFELAATSPNLSPELFTDVTEEEEEDEENTNPPKPAEERGNDPVLEQTSQRTSQPSTSVVTSVTTRQNSTSQHFTNRLAKLTATTRRDIKAKLAHRDTAIIDKTFFKPVDETFSSRHSAFNKNFLYNELQISEREIKELLSQKRRKKFISMKDTVKAPKYNLIKPKNVIYNSFHGILGQDSRDGGWAITETFKSRKNLEMFDP